MIREAYVMADDVFCSECKKESGWIGLFKCDGCDCEASYGEALFCSGGKHYCSKECAEKESEI